jgi:hypothetical protein
MTTSGWLILIFSVGTVLAVFLWCLWLVLTTPKEIEHVHGFEQDPPDPDEEKKDTSPRP